MLEPSPHPLVLKSNKTAFILKHIRIKLLYYFKVMLMKNNLTIIHYGPMEWQ